MKRLLPLAVGVLFVLAPAAQASPTTYYVSPSGSDSNPGTQSAPWLTLSRVNSAALSPGDTVLFQGGAGFSGTLSPVSSGSSSAPITFASYGSGQARIGSSAGAVWLPSGVHDLTFSNLDLTSSGSTVFASAGSGTGSSGITLANSVVHDSPYAGLVNQPQDSNWTISGNTFTNLGDSGLLIEASNVTVDSNTITLTGQNPAITYGKHGIYDKGPGTTISNNDISSDTNGSAVSIRYRGARVFGNTIHDTPYAVSFFPQDPVNAGTDAVYYNKMWNITGFAFYYEGTNETTGAPAGFDVLWASNTVALAGASEAMNVSEITSAQVIVANNIFTGSYGSAYRGCATCSEFDNVWNGASSNIPSGIGDLRINPMLSAAPGLLLPPGSPLIDAGTAAVDGSSYSIGCDGAVWHYCGAGPDLGASEYLPLVPLSPQPDTTAPSAPQGVSWSAPTLQGGTLSWQPSTDNVAVTGYAVYLGDGTRLGTTSATSLPVSGLACGTSYTIGVEALDAAGNASPLSSVTAPTGACSDTVAPTAPSGLAWSGGTSTAGTLSWNASTDNVGVASYAVTVDGAGAGTTSSTSYALSGLACGTSHVLGVDAFDAAGNHSTPATVTVTTRCKHIRRVSLSGSATHG